MSSIANGAEFRSFNELASVPPMQLKLIICHPWVASVTFVHSGVGGGVGGGVGVGVGGSDAEAGEAAAESTEAKATAEKAAAEKAVAERAAAEKAAAVKAAAEKAAAAALGLLQPLEALTLHR